jgi:aminoglycoside phosphotransferase (APT) family kinase protein
VRVLAAGRDCDVFDLGDGTVLRRHRKGRSAAGEAAVMAHVAAHGFPCPRVHRVDGPDLVLERVDGPTLLEELLADPTPARGAAVGAELADLHGALHALPPMGAGPSLLHLDLHPGNVIQSPGGPVLIDWTNATDGEPGLDVAITWATLSFAAAWAGPVVEPMIEVLLERTGRAAAVAQLDEAARRRLADPNLTDEERAAVRTLLRTR